MIVLRWHVVSCLALGSLLFLGNAEAQETRLLIVSGLGGDPEYEESFLSWSQRLHDAARDGGLGDDQVTVLAENPELDPERLDGRSDKEKVLSALGDLAEATAENDQLWVVLIGHGSNSGGRPRLNLPGPDLTAADFGAALTGIAGRVAFINTASTSGEFLQLLSGEKRAVVTATKSGAQRNETHFGDHFTAAFVDARADLDKDLRVSLYEAFEYARQEVARHYESEGLLATENAQLDDNADRVGSLEPDPRSEDETIDGRLAARLFLTRSVAARAASSDPEVARLLAEKERLEEQVDSLRRRKDELSEDEYLDALENLVLELAAVEGELEEHGAGEAQEGSPEEGPSEAGPGVSTEAENARGEGHR